MVKLNLLALAEVTEPVNSDGDSFMGIELPGFFSDIMAYVNGAVEWLKGYMPLDNMALWIKENVPPLANVEQPAMVLAVGMFILWIVISFFTDMLKKNASIFFIGIVVIFLAGYMGMI